MELGVVRTLLSEGHALAFYKRYTLSLMLISPLLCLASLLRLSFDGVITQSRLGSCLCVQLVVQDHLNKAASKVKQASCQSSLLI